MIGIYTSADPDSTPLSSGNYTNPLLINIDGRTGGVIQKLLYLRNNNAAFTYTGISVAVTNGSFTWKLIEGDTQPSEGQWTSCNATSINMSNDLLDTQTFLPFWVRIEVPRNTDVQTLRNISLTVDATENAV